MKKDNKLVVAVVLAAVLLSAIAISVSGNNNVQGGGSSYSDEVPMILSAQSSGPLGGDPVAIAKIKTGEHSDIAILFTAEAALFTDTKITGEQDPNTKGAKKVTDTDQSTIQVYATVDGGIASPGPVTFADRKQTLSGVLDFATWNGNGYHDETIPEEIQLILETTNCNGFNFMAEDVSNGEHTIIIYAVVDQSEHAPLNFGAIGQRSLILQEMKLVNY